MSETAEQFGWVGQVTASFRHRRIRPGLRMTPMIDVVFLLLTFFVLTAQFESPEQALPLVFGAAAAVQQPPEALELTIAPTADGCGVTLNSATTVEIAHDDPAAGLVALARQIEQLVSAAGNTAPPIRLHCDNAVSWQRVTNVYDLLYGLGAREITFVIED